jgi:hypothetical protein
MLWFMSKPMPVAVVTMGGADDASRSVVLSRHAGMVAARREAQHQRNCGRDAIAELAVDFVAAGGAL